MSDGTELGFAWARDCLKWRGRILTGKQSHWCYEWDGLPIDETTPEWPCGCGPIIGAARSNPDEAAVRDRSNDPKER